MVKKSPAQAEAADTAAAGHADAPNFEDAIGELEALVQKMEGGSLSLEESLAAYRRGAELVALCRKSLGSVQQQLKVLEGDLLKPFDLEQAGENSG